MICLFVCDTEFQLLNAINIKYHLLKDDTADILVHNRHPEDKDLIDRIKGTNQFRNIYSFIDELQGVHQYIRDLQNNEQRMGIFEALQNSSKLCYDNMRQKFWGSEEILSQRIKGFDQIKTIAYDEVFAFTNGTVYRSLISHLKNQPEGCKFNLLDEGAGSYLRMDIDEIEADTAYLYEPNNAIYREAIKSTVKIPKINHDETAFIDTINAVFKASDLPHTEINNAIIMCDQGFQKMPPYLSNAGKLRKTIFANSYKKHIKNSVLYDEEIRLFKKVIGGMPKREAYIKFHPRHATTMLGEYHDVNVKVLAEKNLPFELISANYRIKNTLFITPFSSSVIMHHAVLGNENDGNKYILLHHLMMPQNINPALTTLYDKLTKNYRGKFFVPKTEKELDCYLTSL
ncbi:hypothetical protein [Anaerovibrio lipolyticus]|uniref:hypothetical protein n=1 Tax=Anaerovibrio lipolyticus TaxID=82374 RepID=UPI0004844435|nr:hypothetical protein [Anaerovibrio lipolyticus]